jgi:anterior pharynx defective protein 1
MTALTAIGCALIAFGPVGALFFGTVASFPHQIILMILGAFYYLVAYLLTALTWLVVPWLWNIPIIPLFFGAPLQELFRWLYYRTLKKVDNMLLLVSDDKTELRKHKQAYVGGMGFGLMAGALSGINMIQLSGGPGTTGWLQYGSVSLPQSFFIITALTVMVYTFLHICWGVLWFDGFDKRHITKLALVLITHIAASLSTIANLFADKSITGPAVLGFQFLLLVGLIFAALYTAGVKPRNFVYLLKIR